MEVNITCPLCHKSFSARPEEIGPHKTHACPHCGATIKFEGQDLSKVQETVDQLTEEIVATPVRVDFKTHISRPWWKFWKR